MSKEANFAVQAIGGEIGVTHEFERLNEVFAEDVIDHDSGEGQLPGVMGIEQYMNGLVESFPDLKLDVDVLMGDEDYVALAYRLSGTHRGEYMGYAPTGKHFEVRSLQIGRFENGKIKERWGSTDILGILNQLGVLAGNERSTTRSTNSPS
jgi:predicted ester cyclase